MGLVTGVLSLVSAPVRVTLKAWEFGLSTAAEAARLGVELLDPARGSSSGLAGYDDYRAPSHPGFGGNGGAPEAAPEPAPEPPAEPAAGAADAPPPIPDELIPDHVDEEVVLVAEVAEEGAEEGVGPELSVQAPWEGYDKMNAADIRDRLAAASAVEAAAVELYESTHKNRRSVMDAAARALKS